jgi:hypothetical protein
MTRLVLVIAISLRTARRGLSFSTRRASLPRVQRADREQSALESGRCRPYALLELNSSARQISSLVLRRSALEPAPIRSRRKQSMDDIQQMIREHAYQLWDRAGRPNGRSDEFWFAAKAEFEHKERTGERRLGAPVPRRIRVR